MSERQAQKAKILTAMQSGRKLTCLDILFEFGCMNGKGRIHEIRREGIHVDDEWITTSSGARVKRYFLAEPQMNLGL